MKGKSNHKIDGLIEQIVEVNKMIELHKDDMFMASQYIYRRNGFLKKLVAELLKLDGYSPRLFEAIYSSIQLIEKDAAKFSKPLPDSWHLDLKPLAA